MRNIHFLGSSNIEFGRGRDKQKRKRKALLTAAGALGMKAIYNKLKNRKTIKIGNKTLSYQKPGT